MAENSEIDNGAEDDPWADALAEQADAEAAAAEGGDLADESRLSELIAEVSEAEGEGENVELDMILEIPVTISMEIGRTQISIRNLLKLNQGSVVELDRLAGEPLDVLVNGTLIAHGEVVVVNEKFGIRLTDVITAMERIKKLQ
ncbi:MAG: flagellar motor switch protein FliN [Gammaproteobacteria bacterium]|nr:flagellar motor switch protein FliN [Gammaproteobacteria bacterium]